MIESIAGLVVVVVVLVIGLAKNNIKNEERHAAAVRELIEERARLDGTADPARPEVSRD